GAELPPGVLDRGVAWLRNYQAVQVQHLKNAPTKTYPWKEYADDLDALIHLTLVEAGVADNAMTELLYRDRTHLAVYAKALFGLALHQQKDNDKLSMVL